MTVERRLGSIVKLLEGCILGTAAGDAIGLPFENLSRKSVAKLIRLPLEHSLVLGHGMVSDDTEHTVLVALSLLESGPSVAVFSRRLATRLRWWLLAVPPGIGSATARATLKLWMGWPPATSGVYSAGNGPCMRSAILGVFFGNESALLQEFVQASTQLTHTDPKAHEAALAVAVAAACAAREGPMSPTVALTTFLAEFRRTTKSPTVLSRELSLIEQALEAGLTVSEFAARLGCSDGVSGYALHTVPVALYAWMTYSGDFRAAVTSIVQCGGGYRFHRRDCRCHCWRGGGPGGNPAVMA